MRGDYRGAVEPSQLAAENAGKAVIALRKIPSWTHDTSPELNDVLPELEPAIRERVRELAELVHALAPEHGRVTYGEPLGGLTPWDLYDELKANEIFTLAKRAVHLWRKP